LLVRKHLALQQAAVSGPTGVAAPAGHASYRERLLGPDHPDTPLSRNNFANAYQDAGRTDEAITIYEQNLADVERVLGPDHPNTLTSRLNLGTAYRDAGGWMKLKPCYIAPSDIPD
jgi:hypothetical protein